ncbi:MAG TPA: hypothetical protein VE932_18765 [Patescibacteria group bacterium]|nr:hypothetical protein [Patescibacteria group bacterium]
MVERVVKTTRSGWWAIGAAVAVGCAAFLFFRRQRAGGLTAPDAYEEWWLHRERLRASGGQNPQLFV